MSSNGYKESSRPPLKGLGDIQFVSSAVVFASRFISTEIRQLWKNDLFDLLESTLSTVSEFSKCTLDFGFTEHSEDPDCSSTVFETVLEKSVSLSFNC